jgi:transcriptional regulator with XRE-family HTH domain
MCEKENKKRLLSIGYRVKEARDKMGLTQEQFADKYGYARTTLAKLEAGHRDFKSTEIITLAEQLNVSCDYLLGRTRAAAPDDFIQEVVARYGLNEQALQLLERLNTYFDIDSAEKNRIIEKQKAFESAMEKIRQNDIDFIESLKTLSVTPHLTKEEWRMLENFMQEETNEHNLNILNALLVAPTGYEWETYGCLILNFIYNYCCHDYVDVEQVRHGTTGKSTYKLPADDQREVQLKKLDDKIREFRKALIKEG